MRARCIVDCADQLGESALWCSRDRVVYWLDVPMPSQLHRWNPETGEHQTWPMPEMITALAVREQGGLLVASHHGLNFFDPVSGQLEKVAAPEADRPSNRSNDGAADRAGRFWLGTMGNNMGPNAEPLPIQEAAGALYRIDPDLSVHRQVSDVTISNTVCWSPDNRTMYFADTPTGWIFSYAYDHETGELGARTDFARHERGHPDGSTVDAEGYLWNARWDGSCVIRFAPDGSVDRIVELPASLVTSCCFGGDALDRLYITTARYGLDAEQMKKQPEAGGLFVVEPVVKGLPDPRFAG